MTLDARIRRDAAQAEYLRQSNMATCQFLAFVDSLKENGLYEIQRDKAAFLENLELLISKTNETAPYSFPADFEENLRVLMTGAINLLKGAVQKEPRLTHDEKKRGLTLWCRDEVNGAAVDIRHVHAVVSQHALGLLTCPDTAEAWLKEVGRHIESRTQAGMLVRLMRVYRQAEADAKAYAAEEVPDVQPSS